MRIKMLNAMAPLALLMAIAACSDDDDSSSGSSDGGTMNTGGSVNSGGSANTGGQPATGGGGQGQGGQGQGGQLTGDTWNNFAMAFFDTECVECHTAGDPEGRDYTLYAEVVQEAATIRCGVTPMALPDCMGFPPPNQFPIPPDSNPPTPEDRQRIVDWIDAGLPEQ